MHKRIELPSGKIIVVPDHSCTEEDLALHICPSCRSELVYPMWWEEYGEGHWKMINRCPECEMEHAVVGTQEECDLFDDTLEEGTEELLASYRKLKVANMAEDVERFVAALHDGHIEPFDF